MIHTLPLYATNHANTVSQLFPQTLKGYSKGGLGFSLCGNTLIMPIRIIR